MIELKEFQREAADLITERFRRHYDDPPMRGTQKNRRVVPFFQALASITASGKTVILAEAVSSMSAIVPVQPVVLWLSKGKVVVEQSYANLADAGKYHHLLAPATVNTLAQYDAHDVAEATVPLVHFATVGTFNQKDKESGARLIFKSEIDTAESSTWEALKVRATEDGVRRPLIVVYDEGHNLSDQQTDLLLELQPDALIAASATMRLPKRLASEVNNLREEGWKDDELVTQVEARAVADSGLVKSTVVLGGYEAPMEETVSALLQDFREVESEAKAQGIDPPKAIYVSKTNIVEGNSLKRDDPKRPFSQREAPPILIWRYLTEKEGIDPSEIAVYCSLKFDKSYPPPDEFRLFSGGDRDYDEFTAGTFRHVIFNLSLQEGWDDPYCYFAYIDKSMESNLQVEQVIGRLLRQPGGTHYPAERLNTAHFYVRVDKRGVFNDLLSTVNQKLESEAPEVRLISSPPGKPKPEPVATKEELTVFETAYATEEAVAPIQGLLDGFPDFRKDDGANTKSSGGRTIIQRVVGEESSGQFQWEEFGHTNMVSARWLFQREVSRRFQGALGLAPTNSPKFDAQVGFGSPAHKQIELLAKNIVDQYVDNVFLKQKRVDPYTVGPTMVRTDEMTKFKNAVHDGYSDLNQLELLFAKALDETGLTWCRNPARTGYGIPLITIGSTKSFYPDFLVWSGKNVYAIDTTGGHLLAEKTGRKLLTIEPPKGRAGKLLVRFVSAGRFNAKLEQEDPGGYTVWGLKQDQTLRATPTDDLPSAIAKALGLKAK